MEKGSAHLKLKQLRAFKYLCTVFDNISIYLKGVSHGGKEKKKVQNV